MNGSKKNLRRASALLGALLYLNAIGLFPLKKETKSTIMPTLKYEEYEGKIETEKLIQALISYKEKLEMTELTNLTNSIITENNNYYIKEGYSPYCVVDGAKDVGVVRLYNADKPGLKCYMPIFGDLYGYIGLNTDCMNFIGYMDEIKAKVYNHDPELTKEPSIIENASEYTLPAGYTLCELTSTDPNEGHYWLVRMNNVYHYTEVPSYMKTEYETFYTDLKPMTNYVGVRNDVLSLIRLNESLERIITDKYSQEQESIRGR